MISNLDRLDAGTSGSVESAPEDHFTLTKAEQGNLILMGVVVERFQTAMCVDTPVAVIVDPYRQDDAMAASRGGIGAIAVGKQIVHDYFEEIPAKKRSAKLLDALPNDPKELQQALAKMPASLVDELMAILGDGANVLTDEEVEALLAHELAHIKHRHSYVGDWVDTVSRVAAGIGQIGSFAFAMASEYNANPYSVEDQAGLIMTRTAAALCFAACGVLKLTVPFAERRRCERQADRTAAEVCDRGAVLRLHKRDLVRELLNITPKAEGWFAGLTSTHPTAWERLSLVNNHV